MDHAVAVWRQLPVSQREPAWRLWRSIGVAFGAHLAAVGGHSLTLVPGQSGPELAVKDKGESVVRPLNLVADLLGNKRPTWLIVAFANALTMLGDPRKAKPTSPRGETRRSTK